MRELKADVIVGNPMIARQADGRYMVVYAELPLWKIKKLENLTYFELRTLPFVDKESLKYLK